jgi:hypothetical protein
VKFYRWPKGGEYIDEYFAVHGNELLFFIPGERRGWSSHLYEWKRYYREYQRYLYEVCALEVLVVCGSVPTEEDFKRPKREGDKNE